MGYQTRFELTWTPQPECKLTKRKLDLKVGAYIVDHETMQYAIDENGDSYDVCKWYEHEDDMREMSKAIPDVLFHHLSGEGEESGDIWDAWFLNGKGQSHDVELRRKEKPDEDGWT